MPTNTPHLSFEDLFDLKFVSVDFDKFIQIIADLVPAKKKVTIFAVSVDVLIKSKSNAEFFFTLKIDSFMLPDGMHIIWASKLIG